MDFNNELTYPQFTVLIMLVGFSFITVFVALATIKLIGGDFFVPCFGLQCGWLQLKQPYPFTFMNVAS